MGEAKRRAAARDQVRMTIIDARGRSKGTAADGFDRFRDEILLEAIPPHVVIGSILESQINPGSFYFSVLFACSVLDFCLVQIMLNGADVDFRAGVIAAFQRKPGLVIHLADDERQMFRLCEALWPCERITRLRQSIEAERAAAHPAGSC